MSSHPTSAQKRPPNATFGRPHPPHATRRAHATIPDFANMFAKLPSQEHRRTMTDLLQDLQFSGFLLSMYQDCGDSPIQHVYFPQYRPVYSTCLQAETEIAPGGASRILQVPLFQEISAALPLHQSVNCTAVWNTAHSWMPRIGKFSQDPPEPLLSRLSAYRMLLTQFVTRTAVAFAVTLHGFTEPVLKFFYGILARSSFSHFLPCLLYQFLPKPQFVVGIERHRLYHLPQAVSAHRNG